MTNKKVLFYAGFVAIMNTLEGKKSGKEEVISLSKERYEPVSCLSDKPSKKVLLVHQKRLGIKRVVKQIKKGSPLYKVHITEAGLLKNLNHPGIPSLIDIEEDEENIYLIEEYKEGISFRQVLKEHSLSKELFLKTFTGVCGILLYLHNEKKVIHADLKPENVIVSENQVSLIDFEGAAVNVGFGFFTPDYCAPEGAAEHIADIKTDIYALGCMMKEALLSTGNISGETENVILKLAGECMSDRRACRIRNVSDILKVLQKLNSNKKISSHNDPSRIITVAGTAENVGTTFVSLALGRLLRDKGYRTLYLEKNKSGMVKRAAADAGAEYRGERLFNLFGNELVPEDWEDFWERRAMERYRKIIKDFGKLSEQNADAFLGGGTRIIISGSSDWDARDLADSIRLAEDFHVEGTLLCLINPSEKKHLSKFFNILREKGLSEHVKLLSMPYLSEKSASKNKRKTRKMLGDVLNETLKSY